MSRYVDGDIISDDGAGHQGEAWIRGHFSEPDAAWIVGNAHDCALFVDVRQTWARWSMQRWEDEEGDWRTGGYFRCRPGARGAFRVTIVDYVEEDEPLDRCVHPRPRHGWPSGGKRNAVHRWQNQCRVDRLAMGAAA